MKPSDGTSTFDDRTAMWPFRQMEQPLPAHIESVLLDAEAHMTSAPERAAARVEEAVAAGRSADAARELLLARVLYRAVPILRHAQHPERAFVLALEAQPMLERLDLRWRATNMLLQRGLCYRAVGETERALELINEAAERYTDLDDRAELGRCYTAMASASAAAGDLRRAVDLAVRALALFDSQGGSARLRQVLRNNEAHWRVLLGRELAAKGEAAAAQREFEQAVAALPVLPTPGREDGDYRGAVLMDTAIEAHLAHGDVAQARAALLRLMAWARWRRNRFERGLAWMRLTEFRDHQGAGRRAIASARRAAAQFESYPSEHNRVLVQEQLARLLEAAGDLKGAYEALKEAGRIDERQQVDAIAKRAELLMLETRAEREQRDTTQTLEYAQRLSNVGHRVASINHELNQPMSSVKMMAETTIELIRLGHAEEAQANLDVMLKLSTHLLELTASLAAFPAPSGHARGRVSVRHAVKLAVDILGSRLSNSPCRLELQLPDLHVQAVEGPLARALANLLKNALDALEGHAEPRVRIDARADGERVLLRLADNGPGLPDNVMGRLFQPFFSTKAAGQGLGLGLSLSLDILREMGGDLAAANGEDGGAVFTLTLPAAA